ncbi:uridine kinase [Ureaplasma miroungigenitalium]|uniref:Uridine kinase n=1 Tax=Ureaplasma miroungigenitalium TaxID=1042321 RepID=A0ABT3BM80_9BACT|nr:uridine kinase [Ureaplasma miroungigenitalium]MCV3728351.1 uridine kinase [Ureaplasma miroungigenitalium]MCV3734138.1 uridine kinase [Ureaplasma miroungigenitalium]
MRKPVLIIAIAGASGSGKTTIAQTIMNAMPEGKKCAIICQDSYYHPVNIIQEKLNGVVNFDHPKSFDWELMRQQIFAIKNNQAVDIPIYDYVKHQRQKETYHLAGVDVLIVEGIYAIYDEILNDHIDLKVFVQTPKDECLMRRILRDLKERGRDIDSIAEQWRTTVSLMYDQYVKPSQINADIIVPWSEKNQTALDLLIDVFHHRVL